MTTINITTAEIGNAVVPVEGTVTATYWQGARPAVFLDGSRVIVAKPAAVATGVQMTPTGLGMCVQWVIETASGKLTRYTLIPDSPVPIDFEDLETVNPHALTPEPLTPTFLEYVAKVKEGPQGIPGDITPAFFALAQEIEDNRNAAGSSAFQAGQSAAAAQSSEEDAIKAKDDALAHKTAAETAANVALTGQFVGSQPGALNLDTLTQVGRYRFSSAGVQNSTGFPFTGSAAVVDVSTVLNTPATTIQHVVPFSSGAPRGIYQRMITGSGPLPWRLIPVVEVTNPSDQPGYSIGVWDPAVGALRNLMPGGISLGTSDLNTVMLNGHYVQTSSTPSTLERGYPYAGFYGSVEVSGTGTGITRQLAMGFNNTSGVRIYVRNRNTSNTAWLPWQHLPTQVVDQTAGRVIRTWDDANNRQQMIYGDTGWRDISSSLLNGWTGTLKIRRVGAQVELRGLLTNTSATSDTFLDLTASVPGFRIGQDNVRFVIASASTSTSVLDITNNAAALPRTSSHGSASRTWAASWFTTETWPTTLPGTASGTIPNT